MRVPKKASRPSARRPILTERDLEVIFDLYEYRYLTGSQIAQLRFPSQQTANRRIRSLIRDRHIQPFWSPGIDERIFALDRRGAEIVKAHLEGLGIEGDLRLRKKGFHTPKDYYFLRHFLEVNQFRIDLVQGCELSPETSLLGYVPEYHGRKSKKGGLVKLIRDNVSDIRDGEGDVSHTPDSVFALSRNGKPALFFLEIDRGTETISSEERGVLKCFRFYINYLVSRSYRKYEKNFRCGELKGFRVLFVTTTQERVRNIREAASALVLPARYEKARRFIWLAPREVVNARSLLTPIWVSLDPSDAGTYGIVKP